MHDHDIFVISLFCFSCICCSGICCFSFFSSSSGCFLIKCLLFSLKTTCIGADICSDLEDLFCFLLYASLLSPGGGKPGGTIFNGFFVNPGGGLLLFTLIFFCCTGCEGCCVGFDCCSCSGCCRSFVFCVFN